jgi:hypothetical protein
MKRSRIRNMAVGAGLVFAMTATPAVARWEWVEDEYIETNVTVRQEPRGPGYYQQPAEVYEYREEVYEAPPAPVVTHTEVFHDGRCEVTRTYLSDGSWNDDRVCSEVRLVPPHVFILDRIGRHFDRLRYRHGYYD